MEHHLLPLEEIEKNLKTNPNGLSTQEATRRIEQFGSNTLQEKKKKTIFDMLLNQLKDFMILILIAAAIISGLVGDPTDTIVILAIVVLNAAVGLIQEWRAEKAMEALASMAASQARVKRDGKIVDVSAAQIVPGDVVTLEAGNIIPADIRFLETYSLKVDESSLTGESVNVQKNSEVLQQGDYALGDRLNMGYKGTNVTNGRAVAYVVQTGMKTELGKIAEMIQIDEQKTPLQKRLDSFGRKLTFIILGLCGVFFVVGWLRGEEWSVMLLTSISLAVAAIPEALPALVTIALALGAKRLVKGNALIRKLPAVETLGSVTYICSDKTGTLTLNKMTVQELDERTDTTVGINAFEGKDILLQSIALNNDVTRDEKHEWVGESTEVALVHYAADKGYERSTVEKKYPRVAEIPFDSTRKCMTTLHKSPEGVIAIVKGAVDVLVNMVRDDQKQFVSEIDKNADAMAEKGYRTLAYAIRLLDALPENISAETIEHSLSFVGVAGLMDPPRDEARKAVAECKAAGIHPVMITGDHKLTATAIAADLGIISSDHDMVMSGPELRKLSSEKFDSSVENIRVYARVDPEQKLKIIGALQARGNYVAMTGDGVNDAPALKNADIGIAMGINGTQVSKEAAHMILLDDNFATIVVAVRHGRRIFDNILKFIKYIMTGNSGEIWALFLAPLVGLPIPLLPIHILWINLISDGLPGLALASEPAEPDIMQRPPRPPDENVFSHGMGKHILIAGFLIGLVTVVLQGWAISNDFGHWQTMAFTVLAFSQLGHVVAIRSNTRSIFELGLLSNKPMIVALIVTVGLQLAVIYVPFLNGLFKTSPLSFAELAITVAASTVVFFAVEVEKWIRRRRLKMSTDKI